MGYKQGLPFPHWLADVGATYQLSMASGWCSPGCMGPKPVIYGTSLPVPALLVTALG